VNDEVADFTATPTHTATISLQLHGDRKTFIATPTDTTTTSLQLHGDAKKPDLVFDNPVYSSDYA